MVTYIVTNRQTHGRLNTSNLHEHLKYIHVHVYTFNISMIVLKLPLFVRIKSENTYMWNSKRNLRWVNQEYVEGDVPYIRGATFLCLSLANNSPTSRVSRNGNGRLALSVQNQTTYHCPHQIIPILANQWCNSGGTPSIKPHWYGDYRLLLCPFLSCEIQTNKKTPQSVDLFKVNDI